MTWEGTKFFNVKTCQFGVCTYFESSGVHAFLDVKFDDHTENVTMNNICFTRSLEIKTQEKYKHLFWENTKGSGNFCPLADDSFVEDPKELWIQWCALDDNLTSKRLIQELEFLSTISKEDWLKT